MSDDISDFLRRAAEKRASQKPRQRPAAPRQPAPQPEVQILEAADVEIVEAEPVGGVAQHVASHLDTSDISRHAAKLGTKVGLADEKLESHLHETFDHQLGQLGGAVEVAPYGQRVDQAGPAAELAAMLRDPGSIRNAIILSEILNRPEDRWD